MSVKSVQTQSSDASGRVAVEGYKVNPSPMIRPYTQDQIDAVVKIMSKVQGQTQGSVMKEFEAKFKDYVGSNHAFAVDNATNALRLSAILCRLNPDDEVIVPAYTFCATAIPFGKTGAKIVWADIDPVTWVADPKDIAQSMAVGFTINHIAAVVMPAIGGALWMIDYRIPFVVGSVFSLISLMAVQRIPRPAH